MNKEYSELKSKKMANNKNQGTIAQLVSKIYELHETIETIQKEREHYKSMYSLILSYKGVKQIILDDLKITEMMNEMNVKEINDSIEKNGF